MSKLYGNSGDPRVYIRGHKSEIYGHAEVSAYSQTVKLEVSGLPIDMAHKILSIIQEAGA